MTDLILCTYCTIILLMLKEEDKTLGGTHITTIISPLEKVKGGLYIGDLESFTNVNILRKFRIRAVLSVMDSGSN